MKQSIYTASTGKKRSISALIIALIVGLVYLIPHVVSYLATDPSSIYYPFSFAETLYATQVKEVLEGHLIVGDPQFWEHKYTFPSVFPILPVWLIAILSIITGSTTGGFLVSDFLFPAILFLALTGFVHSLLKKKWSAIFISIATLALYQLTAKLPPLSIEGWQKFFKQLFLFEITQPLPFYRTPNPQISFIFLVVAIWALWFLWQKFSWWRWCLTLFFGLSLYAVYFYHITYFLGVLGTLVGASVLTRRYKTTPALISLLILLAAFGIGYFILTRQPQYATLAITGGRFDVRYFDYLFTLRYGLVVILLYFFRRKLSVVLNLFLISLVVSGILVMNFQLFTGWTIQPGHWSQTTTEPIMLVVLGIILFQLTSFLRRQTQIAMWGSFILLVYAAGIQLRFASTRLQDWSIPKDLAHVLFWIDKKTPPQSVVVSLDIATLAYMPILTVNNIFLPIEEYHYATIPEIWERILYAYKLYSVPVGQFDPNRLPIPTFFELTYNVNQYKHEKYSEYTPEMVDLIRQCYPSLCSGLYAVPDSLVAEMKEKYERLKIVDNPYRVDYAVYSEREGRLGALPPNGELVYTSGSYRVIRLER